MLVDAEDVLVLVLVLAQELIDHPVEVPQERGVPIERDVQVERDVQNVIVRLKRVVVKDVQNVHENVAG